MKLAFCLLNYFPYGGLQRDFLRIARECVRRGHEVHVYTTRWDGEREPDLQLHELTVQGLTNHARAESFARQFQAATAGGDFALKIGFNKMPHLDLYYAADVCYQSRVQAERSAFYRMLPRYRAYQRLETSVFAPGSKTDILLISPLQQQVYTSCYGTEAGRFHLLPPGINRDRLAPPHAADIRAATRLSLGLDDHEIMLLMVGSGYQTKGLDRAIAGLASLPNTLRENTHLYVVGKGDGKPFMKQARKLGVEAHVHIVGPRSNVPDFLLAADLLLHPSYHENTGTALLEALAAGLPVLTTAVCGYAHYITQARAGSVLPAVFSQSAWNAELQRMLSSTELNVLGQNGFEFAKSADIYRLPECAADIIEQQARSHVLS